jgi:hypothetical protein
MGTLQIKLAKEREQPVGEDPMGRSHVGYRPGLTQTEIWKRGRGTWKLKCDRVLEQDEAEVIDPDETVVAIAKITGVSKYGDRLAVDGELLVNDPRVGSKTKHPHPSRNPVAFV